MLYTGVRAVPQDQATIKDGSHSLRETQCRAVASDADLEHWSKDLLPVIAAPPTQLEVNGFRDPSPWWQSDWCYLVVASGVADQGGAVLLYRSKDLRSWEYMHILAQRDSSGGGRFEPFDPWEVWECPDFFALGDWHILMYSTAGKVYWQSGKLDEKNMTFRPEKAGILDYGTFYAAKTQVDKFGNRIVWGWISETLPLEEYKAAGWAGVMSLPRVLSADGDGRLRFSVAEEVNQLRGDQQSLARTADLEKNRAQINAMRLQACCGEILCNVRRTVEPFELVLCDSDQSAAPWLTLKYDPKHPDQISIDSHPIPVFLRDNESLEIHLYVDASVIESFVNGQIAYTKRFYSSGSGARNLRLQWTGSTTNIDRLSAWQLSPISANRLTT